jgi:hypothetical protein
LLCLSSCAEADAGRAAEHKRALFAELQLVLLATEQYRGDYGRPPSSPDSIGVVLSPGITFDAYTTTQSGYLLALRRLEARCAAFVVPGTPSPVADVRCDYGDGESEAIWLAPRAPERRTVRSEVP